MTYLCVHLFWDARWVAMSSAFPGFLGQIRRRGLSIGNQLGGVFVTQFIQRKRTSLGHLNRPSKCDGNIAEEMVHLPRRFEKPLAIGEEAKARLLNRAAMARA